MSLDNSFYIDTSATAEEVRSLLLRTGLYVREEDINGILETSAPGLSAGIFFPPLYLGEPQVAGIAATMKIHMSRTDPELTDEWDVNSFRAVLLLLHALPNADALYIYIGVPILLRKNGRIILEESAGVWKPGVEPNLLAMLDLPYTFGTIPRD